MIHAHAMRFYPGDDLKKSIDAYIDKNNLNAVFVLTCVGSLSVAAIRLANEEKVSEIKGPFEIVSLVGTGSHEGGSHLHIGLSDSKGQCIGGHLLDGSLIYTTAEVVLGELKNTLFTREYCDLSGYNELIVSPLDKSRP